MGHAADALNGAAHGGDDCLRGGRQGRANGFGSTAFRATSVVWPARASTGNLLMRKAGAGLETGG